MAADHQALAAIMSNQLSVSIASLTFGGGDLSRLRLRLLLRLRLALLPVLSLRLSRRSERDNSSLSSRLSRRLGGVRERDRDTEASRRLRGGERDTDGEALRLRFLGGGDRLSFEGDLRRRVWWEWRWRLGDRERRL